MCINLVLSATALGSDNVGWEANCEPQGTFGLSVNTAQQCHSFAINALSAPELHAVLLLSLLHAAP